MSALHPSKVFRFRRVCLTSVCEKVIATWAIALICSCGAQVGEAQDFYPPPPPVTRFFVQPVAIESGLGPQIAQPVGTVPPMVIGPAPYAAPAPVVLGPPPVVFGPPLRAPSPFLSQRSSIQIVEPVPMVTNLIEPSPIVTTPIDGIRKSSLPSNFRVSVSEAFLNRVLAREDVTPGPVQDHILGAEVTGQQTTTSRLRVDLVPSSNQATLSLVLTGDGHSLTTGVTPQAMIGTAGQQQFVAVKEVFFDGRLFSTKHATVFVRARNQTVGAMTPLTGTILGGIANQIAFRAAERRRPESEAIARDRVAEKVYPTFDGEVDRNLTTANQMFERTLFPRLESAKLVPTSTEVCTSDNRLSYAALIGDKSLAPAISPLDGQMVGDSGITLSIHDSLLNDLVSRFDLRGFKTTDKELKKIAEDLVSKLNELNPDSPDELKESSPQGLTLPGFNVVTEIEFDETEPLKLHYERDRLVATIKAKFKPAGQSLLPPMKVVIEYRAVLEGNTMRFEADKPRVMAQDRNSPSGEPTLTELAVQKSFEAALPKLEFERTLPQRYWPLRGQPPRVTSIKMNEGWGSIAID